MELIVAGRDRADDLGAGLRRQAETMQGHPHRPPVVRLIHSALHLREATDTTEYLERMLALMVINLGVNTRDVHIAGSTSLPGRMAAWLRRLLWKVFRYQHERITAQQNAVNRQLAVAMGLMREEYLEQQGRRDADGAAGAAEEAGT